MEIKNMKNVIYIIALLSVGIIGVQAQTLSTEWEETSPIRSHQIMDGGATYNGTVYEPFGNTIPSEQTEVGASYSPSKKPGSDVRKGFDIGGDAGQGPSPIGDAMWPLMLLIGAYCGVMIFRRKRALRE